MTTDNTKMNTKKLLSLNNKAFQGLHYVKGYDFTKPFDVVSGDGNFTLNKIKKECSALGIDIENTVATLLVKHTKEAFHVRDRDLYIVDIPSFCKFKIYESYREVGGKYNFNLYYGVGNFEEHRKKMSETWFVVIQKKEYLVKDHNEKSVDYTGKLKATKPYTRWRSQDGKRGGFSQGYFKQDNVIFSIDSKFGVTIDEPLDKSGYWIPYWKSGLDQRLRVYKANKRKKEADGFDGKEIIKELEGKFRELKTIILSLINADEVKKVASAMWKYEWMYNAIERFKKNMSNNNYSSIDSIKYAIDQINGYYNDIINIVNGTEV